MINRDMEAVNKSHDEIVFMHTMLNEKQKKVTEIEKEAQLLESQMRALKQGIEDELLNASKEQSVPAADLVEEVQKLIEPEVSPAPAAEAPEFTPMVEVAKESAFQPSEIVAGARTLKEEFAQKLNDENEAYEIDPADVFENVNEKIISLHKQGFSEVDIAKRLGKGLGEIKLVLGLFDEEEE